MATRVLSRAGNNRDGALPSAFSTSAPPVTVVAVACSNVIH